ncbi:hypothetical protein Taro_018617 [Colocasia esculenta]|uniref:G-patch domain-containing protein n=1 Tax=Colocasia esculenta TaxID=4460 RepID=A0A843UWR4_COLES|nr:hypothetical protein [Colocasia esculenta]
MVNDDLPPSGVTNGILSLTHGPSISFSDKDLAAPECRSLPLYLTINLNGVSVDSTLIDTEASINVCPMKTLKQLGLGENNLEKICFTIVAYDNSKRVSKGKIALQLEIGPVTVSSEFLVLDVDPAYKAILGCPWLEQTVGAPSTAHQCFKFPFNGRVIKINTIPTLETLNSITSEQMPHLFISDKGKNPVMSIFDFPLPYDLNQPSFSREELEHVPCPQGKGWEVMAKIGYIHGRGLGRSMQGPIHSVQTRGLLDTAGLGFHPDPIHPDPFIPYQPLTWTLKEHFFQRPLQPGTREPMVDELSDSESEGEREEITEVEEVCDDFGLLSLFGLDLPSSSPLSPPCPSQFLATEMCAALHSPPPSTSSSRLSSPILPPSLTLPIESSLESSLESGLSSEESSSSQPYVCKEKGRQVPAHFVMALAEKCVKLSQVPEFHEEPALVEADFEEGQFDLIRPSIVENIKKVRGNLQYQGFHTRSFLFVVSVVK